MDDLHERCALHFGLKSVFIATALLAVALAIVVPPLKRARETHNCSRCLANLSMIGLALRNYHDHYGGLPPAITNGPDGRPWHSWRVLILPFLEEHRLHTQYRFDEPWNGATNLLIADMCPNVYRCPSCQGPDANRDTSYVLLTADRSIYTEAGALLATEVSSYHNTLIGVEVAGSGVCWSEPRDRRLNMAASPISRSTRGNMTWIHDCGAHVLFVDGHHDCLQPYTRMDDLRTLLDPTASLINKEGAYRRSTIIE